jgi:hypothetical protein
MEIFGLFIKTQNQGQSIILKHQMVKFKLVMTTKNTLNGSIFFKVKNKQ